MNVLDQAIDHLKHRQQLLAILVFTLVAIMVWIAVSLVSSQTTTSISADLKQKAQPLTPTINSVIVDQIETEVFYPPEDLTDFPIFRIVSDTELAKRSAAEKLSSSSATTNTSNQSELTIEPTLDESAESNGSASANPNLSTSTSATGSGSL